MLLFELALLLIYAVLLGVVVVQIGRIVHEGHNRVSFQFGFLVLCATWCALRVWFFGQRMTPPGWTFETRWLELLVYWLPLNVEFATFGLLVVFYASIVYKEEWEHSRRMYGILYGVLNTLLMAATIAKVVMSGIEFATVTDPLWSSLNSVFATVVFLLLVAPMSVMVWHLYRRWSENQEDGRTSSLQQPTTELLRAAVAILAIFVSRCVYNVLAAALPSVRYPLVGAGAIAVNGPVLGMLFSWEVVPSAIILFVFRTIPKAKRTASLKARQGRVGSESLLYANGASLNDPTAPIMAHHARRLPSVDDAGVMGASSLGGRSASSLGRSADSTRSYGAMTPTMTGSFRFKGNHQGYSTVVAPSDGGRRESDGMLMAE